MAPGLFRDVAGMVPHAAQEFLHVGYSNGIGKFSEERLVIGRVSEIQIILFFLIEALSVKLLQKQSATGVFVMGSEPGVHMNGAKEKLI